MSLTLLAALPDAVSAPAAAAPAPTVVKDPPSPAVSIPLAGAREIPGDDDRAAEAFQARKRPVPVFPAAGVATVDVPAAGAPAVAAAGIPVKVSFPDDALVAELGVEGLLTADAASEQAVPVSRTEPFTPRVAAVSSGTATTEPAPADLTTRAGKPLPGDGAVVLPDPATGPPDLTSKVPVGLPAPQAPAAVQVEVLDRATSDGLGVSGFAFVARRADKQGQSGPVTLTLDVSGFAEAYGAAYLDRLQVLRLPECALAPDALEVAEACGATSVIPSIVDRQAKTVTLVLPAAADPTVAAAPLTAEPTPLDTAAPVPSDTAAPAPADTTTPVPADSAAPLEPAALDTNATTAVAIDMAAVTAGSSGVYALTSAVSSDKGTFAATSLNAAGSWAAGGNSGSVSYDYPLTLPPATGGATPRVALSYSSGSVDGMTPSSNTQASWAGLGWDFVPGFIERKYLPCSLDGHPGYQDLCWRTWNATLSLGGTSYPLIPDASDASHTNWFVRDNPGYEIHRGVSGLADPNQSTSKEYWIVTTPDGTQYYFGRGYGSSTTDPTNSTFTAPVFSDDPGEPSYSASGWTAGQVDAQPWRWNLDRVVDTNGNVTRYYYIKEINRYAKLGNSSWPINYTSGGLLERIEYGTRVGAETTHGQEVDFNRQYRCTGLTAACDPPTKDEAGYPDVPTDLICGTANVCTEGAPSFFDTKRISSVTTRAYKDGAWADVDTWTFDHTWLSPADSIPQLWLDGIQRTGFDGAASLAAPPISFNGVAKENRADYGGSVTASSFYRISDVLDEAGGQTTFTYGQPDPCLNKSGGWDTNTQDCYPVYWTPDGQTSGWGVFNKWVLTSAMVRDRTTSSPDIVTTYTYSNGGAWHHNDDPVIDNTPLTTWDQWRGYSTVKATTGSGPGRTSVKTRYYRGMDGDKLTTGGFKSATVVDADGTTSTADKDILAGKVREVQSFDTGNSELTGSVTGYSSFNVEPGGTEWPDSEMVRPTTVKSRELYYTATGTGTRTRLVTTDYHPTYGVPTTVTDSGDLAVSTDTTCVKSQYGVNAGAWIIDKPWDVSTYDGTCSTGTMIGRTVTYYDGANDNPGTAPSAGNPTRVVSYIDSSGTNTTETQLQYDSLGRVTRTDQSLDNTAGTQVPGTPTGSDGWATTRIAYTPATGPGSPRRIDTTNDKWHISSVSPDGTRGLPEWERKAEGASAPLGAYETSYNYDPLGRVTEVYLESSAYPSYKFAYTDWNTAADGISHVLTKVLSTVSPNNIYLLSADYYDGLGRIREHQIESPASTGYVRVINATRYDNIGRVAATTAGIHSAIGVGDSMYNPDGATTPSETRYLYDELGRTTSTALYSSGSKKSETTATYYGDHTTTVAPRNAAGGYGAVTTYNDVFGSITSLREALPGATHTVDYGYDPLHRLTTTTTQADATLASQTTATISYDWLGRVKKTIDPDAGTTNNTYDKGSRLITVASAANRSVVMEYDGLSRLTKRTATVTGTGAGQSVSEWKYDQTFPGSLDTETSTAHLNTALPSDNPSVATGLVATTGSTTYTITHSNFDEMQRSQTTTYSLPLNEGALGRTYVFGSEWDLAGRLKKVTSPAVGPLPAETITYGYDAKGYPYDVTGTYSVGASNYTTPYVNRIDYTAVGQVKAALLGVADTNPATAPLRNLDTTVSVNYGYAADTLWMNHTDVKIDGSAKYLANQDVTYDRSGLPTQIVDLAAGTNGQTECYRYDSQQRLTAYYTQVGKAGTPLAVNNCVTTGLDSDAVTTADVTSAGGPDGYAALYTVDYLGQLTNLTERRPNAAGAVTTLTSILARAGGTNVPPHGVTSVARKNNGTSVGNQTYGYDASGRQTTRTLPIKTHTLGDVTHGVTSTITYDGNGRWLSSSDAATGDTTPGTRRSGYVYDASGGLLARHDDDAGDDLATAGARPSGQRSLWLGTGGSAGIGATGMAGTGGLQVQVSRKPGATATIAGSAAAIDPAQQLLTVSRSIVAPVLANGAPMQIATHTASALLSASLASGVVTQAATPTTGRVWFTVGDAHASLGGAGTPGITIGGNGPTTDSGSPHSQSVTVAGTAIGAWASGVNGANASAAGTAGIRRTTPYGADRTALSTAAPLSSTVGASSAANTKSNTPGGLGALGFLNAGEVTVGGEDGPVLPGAPSLSGSGYPTTGLVQLGARAYDPELGTFAAPDPVSNPSNLSDADSYTYGNNRIGLATDPTGLVAAHNESGDSDPDIDPPSAEAERQLGDDDYHRVLRYTYARMKENLANDFVLDLRELWSYGTEPDWTAYLGGNDPSAVIPSVLLKWKSAVCGHCPMDYKPDIKQLLHAQSGEDFYTDVPGTGYSIYYDVWANVHYGYIGRFVGFDRDTLELANGGVPVPNSGIHDPNDSISTIAGYDLWDTKGASMTLEDLDLAVRAALPEYVARGADQAHRSG